MAKDEHCPAQQARTLTDPEPFVTHTFKFPAFAAAMAACKSQAQGGHWARSQARLTMQAA